MVSPQAKREAVTVLMTERNFGVTRVRATADLTRVVSISEPAAGALRAARAH